MSFDMSFLLAFCAVFLAGLGAGAEGRSGLLSAFRLEGVMLVGGLAGILASSLPLGAALLIAGAAGAILSLLACAAENSWKGDAVLGGVAVNAFAPALAMVIARLSGGVRYSRKAFEFALRDRQFTVFLPISLVIFFLFWLLLYHTRWGLKIRLSGEKPSAAEGLGVSSKGWRYAASLLGGFSCGLAGVAALIFLGGGWSVEMGVGGLGFLAAAVLSLGRGKPFHTLLAALVMTLFLSGAGALSEAFPHIPREVFQMLPYIAGILILIIRGSKGKMPGQGEGSLRRFMEP